MNSNRNYSAAQRYGLPNPDPGSAFALDDANTPTKVHPYSAVNRSTKGKVMAWENPQPGVGGTFMKFDDDNQVTPPPSAR